MNGNHGHAEKDQLQTDRIMTKQVTLRNTCSGGESLQLLTL